MSLLDEVGVDNVLFETDYPHSDSTWPHSREMAALQFGHLAPGQHRQDRPWKRHSAPRARPLTGD